MILVSLSGSARILYRHFLPSERLRLHAFYHHCASGVPKFLLTNSRNTKSCVAGVATRKVEL